MMEPFQKEVDNYILKVHESLLNPETSKRAIKSYARHIRNMLKMVTPIAQKLERTSHSDREVWTRREILLECLLRQYQFDLRYRS